MTFVIFFIIALLALLPSLYLRYVVCKQRPRVWQILSWSPIFLMGVVLVLLCLFMGPTMMYVFSTMIFCLIMPLLVFTAISAIGWKLNGRWTRSYRIANMAGGGMGALLMIVMLYGALFGWRSVEVKQVDLYFDSLPAEFDGYRIAQLSDLHVGTYGTDTTFVAEIVAQTMAQQPDLIVFTGDIININAAEVQPFVRTLAQLDAPDGVYAVLGNHDYCRYGITKSKEEQETGLRTLKNAIGRMGWHLLNDEHVWLYRNRDSIALAGVGNISRPPYPSYGDWRKALQSIPDTAFTILLSHNPEAWTDTVSVQTTVPLTLSGHTHAAQFKIGGWSPAAWMYEHWGGLYQKGKQQLYVSEGIGGTFAFRLGTKPQIVVLTLHKSEK